MVGARAVHTNNEYEPLRLQIQKQREEHAKKQQIDYSHVFRKKSRCDMLRLSCIIMGIEFAYAAETAFVSPILLEIGIEHRSMTMVWAVSPLIGFFLAPLMGSLSDRCRMKLGRRRPFILTLSLGIFIGLFLVPYGKDIGVWFGDDPILPPGLDLFDLYILNDTNTTIERLVMETQNSEKIDLKFWGAIVTIVGLVLLDFDADTCQTPSRAYLIDVNPPEDHAKCLSTFSILAGIGGSLGYFLGGINWAETSLGEVLGGNIKTVFAIVTIIFVITVLLTVTSFREIPLPMLEKDEMLRPVTQFDVRKELGRTSTSVFTVSKTIEMEHQESNGNDKTVELEKGILDEKSEIEEQVTLGEYLKSIVFMPKSLRILCLTNLLCWMAHLCYVLYFTSYVGEEVFLGTPSAPTGTYENDLFSDGVRFGCYGMSIYALSCSVYSYLIEYLLKYIRTKYVYIGSLLVFAIGMFILAMYPSKLGVLLCSVTAGIIYAVLFTIPFILVAQYHARGSFKVKNGENVPLKQKRGIGTDIAIVSSMIFVAQILVSLSIGSFIKFLGSIAAVIYAAGILGLLAAVSALFVLYIDN